MNLQSFRLTRLTWERFQSKLLRSARGEGSAQRKEGKRLRSISRRGSSWAGERREGERGREGRGGMSKKGRKTGLREETQRKAGNHEGRFPKQSSRLTYWTQSGVWRGGFYPLAADVIRTERCLRDIGTHCGTVNKAEQQCGTIQRGLGGRERQFCFILNQESFFFS